MTVGSPEGAALALSGALPEVGRGDSRVVYRDEDVVYKVEVRAGANMEEHDEASRLSAAPWAPPTSLYRVGDAFVLAMPYFPGAVPDGHDVSRVEAEHNFGGASRLDNLRLRADGSLVVVDLLG